MSADLVTWLREQIAADERSDPPHAWTCAAVGEEFRGDLCDCDWPARVLAEVAAKRAILDLHEGSHECSVYDHRGSVDNCAWVLDGGCSTVLLIAQVYRDRPGFDPSWLD